MVWPVAGKEKGMKLPVVNMERTGQNITMLREQRGISVRQLQGMMGFATPRPFTSGSTASPSPR